jgi:hypothetical protein
MPLDVMLKEVKLSAFYSEICLAQRIAVQRRRHR